MALKRSETSAPKSFREVIGLWPTPDDLADEIGAPVHAARKWAQRSSIPSEWWWSICATRIARAAGVTVEMLSRFAARNAGIKTPAVAEART